MDHSKRCVKRKGEDKKKSVDVEATLAPFPSPSPRPLSKPKITALTGTLAERALADGKALEERAVSISGLSGPKLEQGLGELRCGSRRVRWLLLSGV